MVPAMVVVCVGSSLTCAQQGSASAKTSANVVRRPLLHVPSPLDYPNLSGPWLTLQSAPDSAHLASTSETAAMEHWSYGRKRGGPRRSALRIGDGGGSPIVHERE